MNRLILLVESRIRGDVYVRFGGELPKTHRSNTAGRWMLSLPRLYEKAGKAYQELYKCCTTDKDKSIALNSLASFYAVTEKEDSALILQCKALEYAQISKDSAMIATTALNLSVEYSSKEANDTALYYARMSLQWLPGNKNRSDYHANIGNIFLDKEERDSAIYYINLNSATL